jgi:hypothetical protein
MKKLIPLFFLFFLFGCGENKEVVTAKVFPSLIPGQFIDFPIGTRDTSADKCGPNVKCEKDHACLLVNNIKKCVKLISD